MIAAVGGATVLESLGIVQYELAVFLTVFVVVAYILLSGFRAVMITDIIQGILMIGLVILLAVGLTNAHTFPHETLTETRNISLSGTFILLLFGFLTVFADPTRYQVSYAGKDNRVVGRGMVTALVPFVVTAGAIYVIGNIIYALDPSLESRHVFTTALQLYVPENILSLSYFVFFVALMSTADSNLYALTTHIAQLTSTKRLHPSIIRIFTLVCGAGLIGAALMFRDVVHLAVVAGAFVILIAVPMLYLIAGGSSSVRFIALICGGTVGMATGIFITGLVPESGVWILLGFLISAALPHRVLFLIRRIFPG